MKGFFLMLICCFFLGSCANYGQLNFLTELPKKLDENSGIVQMKDSTAWFIQDGGNSDKLYKVGFNGKLLQELQVKNSKNKDWEDLAADSKGNVYIGDFGNNNSTRKDLVIYKVPNPEVEKGDKIDAKKIKFNYPDQEKFPPKRKKETIRLRSHVLSRRAFVSHHQKQGSALLRHGKNLQSACKKRKI